MAYYWQRQDFHLTPGKGPWQRTPTKAGWKRTDSKQLQPSATV